MKKHYPAGSRLSALEKNILKLRTMEMVLVLFHIEDLRKFVIDSIRASDQVGKGESRLPQGKRGTAEKAWKILVAEGVISDDERKDIEELVDYRNFIAHEIQVMTGDIGRYQHLALEPKFDAEALARVERYRTKIYNGMSSLASVISFRGLMFEAAERTYKEEIKRLRSKIRRQVGIANQELDSARESIQRLPEGLLKSLEPGHPRHTTRSGTLSQSGIQCCRDLFNAGVAPLAVSYLMRLSLRSVMRHYRAWQLRRQ